LRYSALMSSSMQNPVNAALTHDREQERSCRTRANATNMHKPNHQKKNVSSRDACNRQTNAIKTKKGRERPFLV